ncbi:MAG: ADP-forming succinate--CoA ligase subunit beta [Elusimicrobia bacterium]|nr:ADP-forming succinate--CoA ligase subunit beta [Elusimicrobiota bacterium]
MKLLEHEAKALFRSRGVPVPPTGGVIKTLGRLSGALKRAGKGPWVLKAQVLAGGRGKAGGVKLAKNASEAKAAAKAILGMRLISPQTGPQGVLVHEVLVDKATDIARELYLSIVLDRREGRPVVMASAEGGMEIEQLAREKPGAILREPVSPARGIDDFQARRMGFALRLTAEQVTSFVKMVRALTRLFIDYDASLVEVNPLVVTKKGELIALDAKMSTDDNALFRHPDLASRDDIEAGALEKQAKKVGISYIELDGSIGCMVNGAGLAMATMDTVSLAGGRPANFLDVGGGANADQVTRAFQIILKDKRVKAVLVNIFGGIMKCTTIADGVLQAVKKVHLNVPLIVRLEGTQVAEAKAILDKSGLPMIQADSLWDAAQKAVKAASEAPR